MTTARAVPFHPFFQVLTIFGFVRTGFGTPLGTAIIGHIFSSLIKKNTLSLSSKLNLQNYTVDAASSYSAINKLQQHVTLVTIKEVYGYAAIAGLAILIIAVSTRYKKILNFKMPRW